MDASGHEAHVVATVVAVHLGMPSSAECRLAEREREVNHHEQQRTGYGRT
jgi:hypothetical protein